MEAGTWGHQELKAAGATGEEVVQTICVWSLRLLGGPGGQTKEEGRAAMKKEPETWEEASREGKEVM